MPRFIRPGFVVVIVGFTLTSLSTLVVTARYVATHLSLPPGVRHIVDGRLADTMIGFTVGGFAWERLGRRIIS